MPKRRGRACKESKNISENANQEDDILSKEEVECQSAAVRAIYNLEIKDILSLIRLLRSIFNEEQLHIPVVQYFRKNLSDLDVVRNEDGTHEVKRKEADGNFSMDQFNGRNLHLSLLRQLSMAYPDCSNAILSFGGFGSSSKSGIFKFLLRHPFPEIQGAQVLEDPSDTQMFELQDTLQTPDEDTLQTPDVNNNPLSIGMTPKTLRLPKTGEVLSSVHGSPLGVYKEDNMEPIHESEDA